MMNLDEIEARANAATPGPWTYDEGCGYVEVPPCGTIEFKPGWERSVHFLARVHNNHVEGEDGLGFDGAFIAAARTDVPALIARVRELEERLSDTEDRRYRLTQELDEALADYQDLWRTMHEECSRLEAECERLKTFAAQNFSQMIRQEAEQMRAYGLSYEGVRKVLREHDDGEISFGKLMDLIRAAARAMAEEECAALRALLVDAHRELATIEAITVSPSGVDGLIELVHRIGQKLESSK